MIINHNLMAMNAHRQLGIGSAAGSKSMEKLSSGYRINRAGDDAAGLSISEKMRAQIRGLNMSSKNAQDGISMIQTAEGALNETHSILQRMRELADQSANGTNTAEERQAMQNEITQLKEEIDRIGNTTEFNTKKLLNGSLKSAGGSVVGQDTTIGSAVAKLEAGKTAAVSMAGTAVADTNFVAETITIDKVEIEVNWQNLSSADQSIIKTGTAAGADADAMKAAAELITKTINDAIDESGYNIEHVNGYIAGGTDFVLESGSEGINSEIVVTVAANELLGSITGATTATGTCKYSGTDIAAGAKFDLKIGDITMQAAITTSSAITNGTTTMEDAASNLESVINAAISTYNNNVLGSDTHENAIKDVKVNVTDDGRFEIISESGPISFSDLAGETTVSDLGLSQAQTEASGNGGMTLQIGANRGQTMTFGIDDMRSASLGIASVDVATQTGASKALDTLDVAIKTVSEQRSALGAVQNRLEHTIKNLDTSAENLQASESRIRDVDMAQEMMEFTKNNILQQAAQAMLAQANQAPQGVLQLLR